MSVRRTVWVVMGDDALAARAVAELERGGLEARRSAALPPTPAPAAPAAAAPVAGASPAAPATAATPPIDAVVTDRAALPALLALPAPRPPLVLLVDDPAAPDVASLLRGRAVAAALHPDLRPGELSSTALLAADAADAWRTVERERRGATRRLEAVAALGDIAASLAELGSYGDVLGTLTRELRRVVDLDLAAAVLAGLDGPPRLALHSERSNEAGLVRTVRDRCLEALRDATGRAVDEDQLVVALSGHPVLTAGVRSLPSTLEVPIQLDGRPVGLVLIARGGGNAFTTDERAALVLVAARLGDALRKLRARLSDQRRRLSLMVEAMADGLILTDKSTDELLINPAARRLLGLDHEGPVTQQFLKDKLGFYPFDLVATGSDAQGPMREEVRVHDKILHSIVSPVRDPAGKLEGVVVVLRDFTEAKALARRQAEFVAVVSHELRSPLTSITGALDLAVSDYAGRLTERQRRYLEMAREGCVRLNQLVDDLVDMARSERGKMSVQLTPLLLDDQAREVVDRFRAAAEAKKIRLALRSEAGAIRIVGDPDRLTQVLNNLLSNAIKFTPEGGAVEVEVFGPSVSSSHVGVSVFNNGQPIPDEARERIFDKFERLDESSTRQVGGTGLGLAISRAIIEAHGGRIWAESRPDGAKFVFTLPAAPDADQPAPPIEDAGPAPAVPGATVLLVDDDVYAAYIVKGILMGAGHEVLSAETADDAIALARSRRPALVVVDLGLRGGDPLALLGILKHDPDTRKAAVLALGSGREREDALRAGADDVGVKPIAPAELRDQAARLIAEAGRARSYRVLTVDDDTTIRTICREVLAAAGYAVREAASGVAGLAEARRFKPDLILLDVMMPELDGFQTAEALRGDPATSMIPIIFLSARGETADKVRAFRLGAEDYVVKPFVSAELVARVGKALERRERELGASPTTQLPGANAIEEEIERRLVEDPGAAYCYVDLDNLKSFNDYYGYARADGVIRQTADLLRDVLASEGTGADFLGHIAGDDFVFITRADAVDRICTTICAAFDRLIPIYYNKTDRERGYIEAVDRFGVLRRFPLMSVSLAAVTSCGGTLTSYAQLAEAAAAGKKLAKGIEGSSYVRDGRVVQGTTPAPTAADAAATR